MMVSLVGRTTSGSCAARQHSSGINICEGGRGRVYYSQLSFRVNFDACATVSITHTATCAGTTLICTGTKAVVRDDCALFCEPLHVRRLLSKERKWYKQREVPKSVNL